MNNRSENIDDERISFRDMILRFRSLIIYLFRNWKLILMGSMVIAFIRIVNELVRDPIYNAETTFVLETRNNDISGISSIVSAIGVNMGGISKDNDLFDVDHIIKLYTSNRMLKEAFLTEVELGGITERLITRYAKSEKLIKKWKREDGMKDFSFEVPLSTYNIKHDSILFEVFEKFREKFLVAERLDRKLYILSVQIKSEDALFAKAFNEVIVNKVNQFYINVETKKTGDNLAILEVQVDSVKKVLDTSLSLMANEYQLLPNRNPLYYAGIVPTQKMQVDIQASAAVYEELLKNLEVAKISHRNKTPLIQIIDRPILPLKSDKDKLLKMIIVSGILGWFITISFFTFKLIYKVTMNDKITDG